MNLTQGEGELPSENVSQVSTTRDVELPPRKTVSNIFENIQLPDLSPLVARLKEKFRSSNPSFRKSLFRLAACLLITFILLTVYLSGSKICKNGQTRSSSCFALGLCSNRNQPQDSLASKMKNYVICPVHGVLDRVISKTSLVFTGLEDPFGAGSMLPGIDLSVFIF